MIMNTARKGNAGTVKIKGYPTDCTVTLYYLNESGQPTQFSSSSQFEVTAQKGSLAYIWATRSADVNVSPYELELKKAYSYDLFFANQDAFFSATGM